MIKRLSILALLASAVWAYPAPPKAAMFWATAYAGEEDAGFVPYTTGLAVWIKADGLAYAVNQNPQNHASSGIVITNSASASSPAVGAWGGEDIFYLDSGKYWSISPAITVDTNILVFARINRMNPGSQTAGSLVLLGDSVATPFIGYLSATFRSRMNSDSLGYPDTNKFYGVMVGFCDGVTNCVDFEPDGYSPSADNVPGVPPSGQYSYIGKRSTSVTSVGGIVELFIYTNGPAIPTDQKARMLERVSTGGI